MLTPDTMVDTDTDMDSDTTDTLMAVKKQKTNKRNHSRLTENSSFLATMLR